MLILRPIPGFGLLVLLLGLAGCGWWGSPAPAYGTWVAYSQGRPLAFPDFAIEFLGQRHEQSEVYPRSFTYYDFKVSAGGQEQVVSWTTGTGVIGPEEFQVAGRTYWLELSHTDKLGGWWRIDELVIQQK